MKREYVLDRVEKAVYMGFLLSKDSNEHLGKNVKLDYIKE